MRLRKSFSPIWTCYLRISPNETPISPSQISGVAQASQKLDLASSALIGRAPAKSATSDAIIVVHSGKTTKQETAEDDPNLQRLKQVPMCYPLLKGPASLSNGEVGEVEQLIGCNCND